MYLGLKIVAWLALSAWFGSWMLFALVVAPTVFRIVPAPHSGDFAAAVLPVLYLSGAGFGAILASVNAFLRRGRFAILLPLLLALLAAFSQLAITPAVTQVLPSEFDARTAADAGRRFASLHMAARGVFGAVCVGLMALVCLQVRWDQRGAR